jgi:hypothetical protein
VSGYAGTLYGIRSNFVQKTGIGEEEFRTGTCVSNNRFLVIAGRYYAEYQRT